MPLIRGEGIVSPQEGARKLFFCLSNPFPSSSYPPVLRVEEEEGKEVVVVVVMLEEEEKVKIPF